MKETTEYSDGRRASENPTMAVKATLHLGCGNKKSPGAVGIDINPKSQADIIHDLNTRPWPLESDAFDRVICEHVLEHLDDIVRTMAEIYRVCKNDAVVEIITPHFSSVNSWDDPTHKHHFTLASFDYFRPDHGYSYADVHLEVVKRRLKFSPSLIKIPARIIYAVSPRWYEKNLAFIMPARNLEFTLRVLKNESKDAAE